MKILQDYNSNMVSYATFDEEAHLKLRNKLQKTEGTLSIVSYFGEAYVINIDNPHYNGAFLYKNDLYGDLVNSCAKSFIQTLKQSEDKICICHNHKSERIQVEAFNWNTI